MKTTSILGALAIAGLMVCGGLNALAQGSSDIVQTLSFKLTAKAETNWTVGSVTKYKLVNLKVDTKAILTLLETATTNSPGAFAGASLVLVNFGDAIQVRLGTNVLADVSQYFDADTSDDVSSGMYDDDTGKDIYLGYYGQQFEFDDGHGHQFELLGLVKEVFTASAADASFVRKISGSMVMDAGGTGTWDGEFVVLTGSLSAKGKGTDMLK